MKVISVHIINKTYLAILLVGLLLKTSLAYGSEPPIVFVAEQLPPYHYVNQQGQTTGAFVEVIHALLHQAELKGSVKIQPFARSFKAAVNQPNTFLISLLNTPSRKDAFQWVGKIYQSYAVLVGLKNRDINHLSTLEDAKPYIIGTIRGYHSASFLIDHGFTEQENLSLSVTSKHMWGMLFNQRIDFVMTNYIALDRDIVRAGFNANDIKPYIFLYKFPNELNIATGLLTSNALVEKLSQALVTIKQNGEYQKIMEKYDL